MTEKRPLSLGYSLNVNVLRKVVSGNVDPTSTAVSALMTKDPDTLGIDSPLVFALHRDDRGRVQARPSGR